MDIVLAVFAWRRGWKAWALLPIGMAFLMILFIGGAGVDGGEALFLYVVIGFAELGTLGFMVAKPRLASQTQFSSDESRDDVSPVSIPIDKPSSLPATVVSSTGTPKLVLPDGLEIPVNAAAKPIGRVDFDKVVSQESLKYISRQHLVIEADDDKYFIEDLNSTNGTKTNGVDIRGKRRQELKDGDRINVADVVELTFKA